MNKKVTLLCIKISKQMIDIIIKSLKFKVFKQLQKKINMLNGVGLRKKNIRIKFAEAS